MAADSHAHKERIKMATPLKPWERGGSSSFPASNGGQRGEERKREAQGNSSSPVKPVVPPRPQSNTLTTINGATGKI